MTSLSSVTVTPSVVVPAVCARTFAAVGVRSNATKPAYNTCRIVVSCQVVVGSALDAQHGKTRPCPVALKSRETLKLTGGAAIYANHLKTRSLTAVRFTARCEWRDQTAQ